jgi:hypothetical protein
LSSFTVRTTRPSLDHRSESAYYDHAGYPDSPGISVLEVMFFVGAAGCVVTILVPWLEIFVESFSEDRLGDK